MGGTSTLLVRAIGRPTTATAPLSIVGAHVAPSNSEAVGASPSRVLRTLESGSKRGVQRFADSGVVSAEIRRTLQRARALVAQKKAMPPRHETDQLGFDGHLYNRRVYGMPDTMRLAIVGDGSLRLPADPRDTMVLGAETVFRHYTDETGLRAILRTERLIPGPWPHSYGAGESWVDLIGGFLTSPRYRPGGVLPADYVHFVDLHLLPGTGLVDLSERGKRKQFLMIPGTPQHRKWYRESYYAWVRAGRPSKREIRKRMGDKGSRLIGDVDEFQKILAQGGFPKPSRIPIVIVDTGRLNKK